MNIDSFITKSLGHIHCEDYLFGGFVNSLLPNNLGNDTFSSKNSIGLGIVSDGCGDERALYTDIGSRIMVSAAKKILLNYNFDSLTEEINNNELHSNKYNTTLPLYMQSIIQSANRVRLELNLPENSLDATLLFFISDYNSNIVRVVCYGDGVIVWKLKETNIINIRTIDFLENMPFYPAIYLSEKRLKDFNDYHHLSLAKNVTKYIISDKTGIECFGTIHHHSFPITYSFNLNDIELLMIGTDGLTALEDKKDNHLLDIPDIVQQIFDFKSLAGKFLERKMQNKIMKECNPLDDLALVALYNPSNLIL